MGLFSKKEEVPKIPTSLLLPSLPSITEEPAKKDLPGLPSFPSSSKNENFNQEMVKSAVSDMPSPGEREMYMETPESPHIKEEIKEESMIPPRHFAHSTMPEFSRPISSPSQELEESRFKSPSLPPRIPSLPASPTPTKIQKQNEPIFVRIDKLQTAQKNFEDIKSKVIKVESILKKIKDIKSQEEEELKGWTEDVEKLKSRLMQIDNDIFSQL
jgi:hypothetical protein